MDRGGSVRRRVRDAVVAGQAAHWFDPEADGREILRVLETGGVLGPSGTRKTVAWVVAPPPCISAEARGHEADQGVVDRFAQALPAQVDVFESASSSR